MLLRVLHLFIKMVYAKTPSATVCVCIYIKCTYIYIYNQMTGNLMTNEQGRMSKEAVVANWYNIPALSWRDFGKPRTACPKLFGRGWNGVDTVNASGTISASSYE
jgi:hypothetical protein